MTKYIESQKTGEWVKIDSSDRDYSSGLEEGCFLKLGTLELYQYDSGELNLVEKTISPKWVRLAHRSLSESTQNFSSVDPRSLKREQIVMVNNNRRGVVYDKVGDTVKILIPQGRDKGILLEEVHVNNHFTTV